MATEIKPGVAEELLADALGPELALIGMRRVRYNRPCWSQEQPDGTSLYLLCQSDPKATDAYAGGGIRLEMQRNRSSAPDEGLSGRALFFQLLDPQETRRVLALQNEIIGALTPPPPQQVELYPVFLREQYRSYFKPQDRFDAIRSWLRFQTGRDLAAWGGLFAPLVGRLRDRASRLDPETLYLGQGILPIVSEHSGDSDS